MDAYKLFERNRGMPRTLVHGMPRLDGSRSRAYELDTKLYAEPGTPGFCVFSSKEDALKYLPRFRVRAGDLILCKVSVGDLLPNLERSQYRHYATMTISSDNWYEAVDEHGKK